jgi:hypothetical protein
MNGWITGNEAAAYLKVSAPHSPTVGTPRKDSCAPTVRDPTLRLAISSGGIRCNVGIVIR